VLFRSGAEATPAAIETDEAALSDLYNLRSVPMAALHLTLRRALPIHAEHIVLYKSRFLTSFIDLRTHWGLPTSELSIIASDFAALETLADDDPDAPDVASIDCPAARAVVDEMIQYLPELSWDDIVMDRSYSLWNVRRPLFLNTVGAWPYRPGTKTRLENLYVAGDYCQTSADITTMESAVISGLGTAKRILADLGMPDTVTIKSLKNDEGWNPFTSYPRIPLRLVEWLFAPAMAALYMGWVAWKWLAGDETED